MALHNKTLRETTAENRRRQAKSKIITIFVVILAVVFSFALGFSLRGNSALVARLGMNTTNDSNESSQIPDGLTGRFYEVEQIINQYAIYSFDVDVFSKSIVESISQSSNDPYFKYYTNQQYADYSQDIAAENTDYGIGVLFADVDGKATVLDVFPNSPASKAAISKGDTLVSINDEGANSWSTQDASSKLSKMQDQTVSLT